MSTPEKQFTPDTAPEAGPALTVDGEETTARVLSMPDPEPGCRATRRQSRCRGFAHARPVHPSPPGASGITGRKIFWHNILGVLGRHRP